MQTHFERSNKSRSLLGPFAESHTTVNTNIVILPQGLHSHILMTGKRREGEGGGGGGPTEVHILYPKNPNFRICLRKKIPTLFIIPKKIPHKQKITLMLLLICADKKYNTQKIPIFFATQKNYSIFHRPHKIPFVQNFRSQKILRTSPPLKCVSGAPGHFAAFSQWFYS